MQKSSGLASIGSDGPKMPLQNIARLEAVDKILSWIQSEAARAFGDCRHMTPPGQKERRPEGRRREIQERSSSSASDLEFGQEPLDAGCHRLHHVQVLVRRQVGDNVHEMVSALKRCDFKPLDARAIDRDALFGQRRK
jgi:hypothetical protein